MSAQHQSISHDQWVLRGSWAGAYKIAGGIGAVGLVASLIGYTTDPRRFAFSWLFAFVSCLAVALGALFFVLVQRLTGAGWSVTVRRTAEFWGLGILALAVLSTPLWLTSSHLWPFLGKGAHVSAEAHSASGPGAHAEHSAGADSKTEHDSDPHAERSSHAVGATSASRAEHAAHEAHALIHHETMAKKAGYLTSGFFYARAFAYFVIWGLLATKLFGFSVAQDATKDPKLTLRAQRFAPAGMMFFALSLTFVAFDWIMALEPTWFSTIFGVYYFAASVVSSIAVMILVTLALRAAGPLSGAVTTEHYHDLGKLLFGFLVFWAYIAFSQFMLIWYAALPEETTWYHHRWDSGPWAKVSMALLVGHFIVPFFWLISRNFKRALDRLKVGASVLLFMHLVDMYWLVMPNLGLGSEHFSFHWLDITCVLAVAGTYSAVVFFLMTRNFLVPVGDPRLQRSLHFQNA